jgi:hypothetical protein
MLEGREMMSISSEFFAPVNTKTSGSQFLSDTASSANGSSVAVWVDTFSPTDHDIKAQPFNSAGARIGPELTVSASGLDEATPKVAMDRDGNFVVTWMQTLPGGDTNVVARRFNSLGIPVGGVVQVGVGTFKEHNPDVAMDDQGHFVVAYMRDTNNNNPDVFAKRYDINNNLLNVVNVATTSKAEINPTIAMALDGRFDVAYQLQFSSSDDDILVNRYGPTGVLFGTNAVATSGKREQAPSIAMDNFGNAVVAYQKFDPGFLGFGGDWDIKARRISGTTGLLIGGEINIRNTGSDEVKPSVALNRIGSGGFAVAYQSVSSQPTRALLAEVSALNAVATFDMGQRFDPAVSIDASNNYLVTYTSIDSGDLNIRGRRGQLFSIM